MSKRRLTKQQIEDLVRSGCVENCSERSITYREEFKMRAVELYRQGMTSAEIFRQAGLSPDLVGKEHAHECLRRWREVVEKKGVGGLVETRGANSKSGRPKTKGLTDADKITRLEVEVAYLKAENAFLAKLRAKRRE